VSEVLNEPQLQLLNFFRDKDDFPLIILFGSYADGRQTETSDVDVAFYVEKPLPVDERLALQDKLQAVLSKTVDLIDLRDAHGALLQEVLVRGLRIKNEDPAVYERLLGRMLREKENDARVLQKIVDLRLK